MDESAFFDVAASVQVAAVTQSFICIARATTAATVATLSDEKNVLVVQQMSKRSHLQQNKTMGPAAAALPPPFSSNRINTSIHATGEGAPPVRPSTIIFLKCS